MATYLLPECVFSGIPEASSQTRQASETVSYARAPERNGQNRAWPRFAYLRVGVFVSRNMMRRAFSFPALLCSLLLASCLVACFVRIRDVASPTVGTASTAIFEGDLWWHIAVGERILSTHRWPSTDPFSFTAKGNDRIAFEWLWRLCSGHDVSPWRAAGTAGFVYPDFCRHRASALVLLVSALWQQQDPIRGYGGGAPLGSITPHLAATALRLLLSGAHGRVS